MDGTQLDNTSKAALDYRLDRIIAGGILTFLVLLPFHLVIKQLVPGPAGTYWKEALLAVLVLLWCLRCIRAKKIMLSGTALDLPVLLYAGLIVLHLMLERNGEIALWGAYISILYLPIFWLIPLALRRFPRMFNALFLDLTIIGALVSLGGILEFLLDKSLWPSVELTTRQGFPDMYVYGTHLRRVYFVFDSPTTLANTLAMILPLAFLIFFQSRKLWERILAGISAGLIFTAILLTFSRGIWVALALSAGMIALVKLLTDRNWKFLARALTAALAGLIILGVVWAITPIKESDVDQFSIELLPAAYQELSLGGPSISLAQVTSLNGEPETQVWTIFDPVEQRDDQREVVYMHPSSDASVEWVYAVKIPESALLRFSIALSPEVWTPDKGDGVNFKIYIREQGAETGEFVFVRYINPKANPSDRRWRNYAVDLSAWDGKEVYLSLIAESGPAGDYGYDWAGWADLDIGSVDESYVAANWPKPKSPIAEHLASITDWTKNESNRDRIAAWNMAFEAWKKSPIWGNGLGTTGVAALRTMPKTAIVTESQPFKAVVELGIPGILAWAFLWFIIFRTALRLYQKEEQMERKTLVLVILSGLLITFIDGLVYQNLEVKQVNAFFWVLVGVLAYFQSKFSAGQSQGDGQP